MFLDNEMIVFILSMSNQKLDAYVTAHPTIAGDKDYQRISLIELYAFLGLMVVTGVLRISKEPVDNLWCADPNKSRPILIATMARDRFKVILRFLRFDDTTTRTIRQKDDKLAPIRYIIDLTSDNLLSCYSPGKWVTVDEHLCRYRGRCSFKQFIPSKPDRYGLKYTFWLTPSIITLSILRYIAANSLLAINLTI